MDIRARLATALTVALAMVFALCTHFEAPADAATTLVSRNPDQAGTSLPGSTTLSSLSGRKLFVAPNGSDSAAGTQTDPLQTLSAAVDKAGSGSVIVLRGGTYPGASNAVSITKKLTVINYPGETPVFDGSIAAPKASAEGSLRAITYRPMPARTGEGLNLSSLPMATFSGNNPTGLAAAIGWRCVAKSGNTYATPSGGGKGCSAPRVITGYYPDQVWVNGKALTQVLDKGKVVAGKFYVERSAGSDASPGAAKLYLSAADSADMSKVRVSATSGTFLTLGTSGITVQGIKITRMSPTWAESGVRVSFGANDVTLKNVEISDISSTAMRVMGGDAANQSQLTKRTTLDQVTISRGGWLGVNATYSDDTSLLNVAITGTNPDSEFITAPKSGAVKASKTHGMKIIGSVLSDNNSHGVWWDQSNYNALLANSKIVGNRDSGVFYEISYGLTMVNNLVVVRNSSQSTPAVRLAGATNVKLVNNTIVGSQSPLVLAGDARSKTYGPSNRPCAEHPQRYGKGGGFSSDCPPGLSSDLDSARPGAFGGRNLTPGLTWNPSAVMLVNNVIANPGTGSGGICPGGYPVCVKGYAGSTGKPTVAFKTNQMLPAGMTINGNVYQAPATVMQIRVAHGGSGGVSASSLAQLKSALSGGWYQLKAEANGLAGTGWVTSSGAPTPALEARQGQAAAVPSDPTVNVFVAAGSQRYGSSFAG